MKLMKEDMVAPLHESAEALQAAPPDPAGVRLDAPEAPPAASDSVVAFRPRPGVRQMARFDALLRTQHLLLMISFLVLAATGLPLLFSEARWAGVLARLFGGFRAAGIVHRAAATVLIAVFLVHVARLFFRLFVRRDYDVLWGPTSMVPQPRDVIEMAQHVRWFVGLGARPKFDHFTYWEKFDYWAVFWGMLIIGGSGLLLWFPMTFSRVVPGWAFNIALLIHGEEALLAVAFIFTIHFFNGHLRPEKFPMDTVIFTGRVTEAELRAERPGEYERLTRAGALDALETSDPPHWLLPVGRVVGTAAVAAGIGLFALILYAVFV